MRNRRLVPTLALLPALLLACGEPPAEEPAEAPAAEAAMASDEEAITALGDQWESQYNQQNAEMVAAMYTDSSWVMPAGGGMFMGRPAVQGWLTASMETSPTIEVTPHETLVSGDYAVGLGSYAISVTPEGAEPMGYSGSYLNALERIDGEWKIVGTVSNFDAPPPEDWEWDPAPEGEMPPDNPRFPDLNEAYETAFNAGDAAAIAALHTDDAKVAFADGPLLEGSAAVQESLAARMTEGATLDVHEAGSQDLGNGWVGAGGSYEIIGPDGTVAQSGFWMNVLRVQDDGTARIAWALTNARPAGM